MKVATMPRLGFLGVGHIGKRRMEALVAAGAEVAGVVDPAREETLPSLDSLLEVDLDGIVIATPSGLHAQQAVAAIDRGVAVFCQKPLARNATETRAVVDAARRADVLLGVDLSYRFTEAMVRVRELVAGGDLGEVYAAELVFHNAYGPPPGSWFYDRVLAGGGCVLDLGTHLVDLARWTLDADSATVVGARTLARGRPLRETPNEVEDYADALLEVGGVPVRVACSWNLPAGRDAVIEIRFFGTAGGAALVNVDGSFVDFRAEHYRGTETVVLAEPPDAWGGRAAVDWARRLAAGERFDEADARDFVVLAETLDAIYAGAGCAY